MKKRHYPLGYKVVLFLAFQCFMGPASLAVTSSTSEDKTKEISDRVFKTLVQKSQERQERQEAVSTILKENHVIGVVFEKDDGSFCQVSKQENLEDYIPRFVNIGDSLEDFDLPDCGEKELATLAQIAQVAAVYDGPSQARVALMPMMGTPMMATALGFGTLRVVFSPSGLKFMTVVAVSFVGYAFAYRKALYYLAK